MRELMPNSCKTSAASRIVSISESLPIRMATLGLLILKPPMLGRQYRGGKNRLQIEHARPVNKLFRGQNVNYLPMPLASTPGRLQLPRAHRHPAKSPNERPTHL